MPDSNDKDQINSAEPVNREIPSLFKQLETRSRYPVIHWDACAFFFSNENILELDGYFISGDRNKMTEAAKLRILNEKLTVDSMIEYSEKIAKSFKNIFKIYKLEYSKNNSSGEVFSEFAEIELLVKAYAEMCKTKIPEYKSKTEKNTSAVLAPEAIGQSAGNTTTMMDKSIALTGSESSAALSNIGLMKPHPETPTHLGQLTQVSTGNEGISSAIPFRQVHWNMGAKSLAPLVGHMSQSLKRVQPRLQGAANISFKKAKYM